jgi:hypothetical protein
MPSCIRDTLDICWVLPSSVGGVFSFTEFLQAIALLAVVYTVSDARYRFRLAVAPLPLFGLTYWLAGFIGFAALITDVWVREEWLVPSSLISQIMWRGILGALFLLLVWTWLYYAFISPPIYRKSNYKRYAQALYRVVIAGSEEELPVIADELGRSASNLVTFSTTRRRHRTGENDSLVPDESGYAHDVLLLIANRKICRHIVTSAPGTAIKFFQSITDGGHYNSPIGQFASNISAEAILQRDSILYHEDEWYHSGLLGYMKPFTKALYGDYQLVERAGSQGGNSPLDIHYEIRNKWDAPNWEAYSRAVLTTLKGYLEGGYWGQHSFSLFRAIGEFEHASMETYMLKSMPESYFSSDSYGKLRAAVDFISDAIDLLNKQDPIPAARRLRANDEHPYSDLYDKLAHAILEVIFHASAVTGPPDTSCGVHYGSVWSKFFTNFRKGGAWDVVRFKVRRLLYDEIVDMDGALNYRSARILGLLLNVMGLDPAARTNIDAEFRPLKKAILRWTTKNYLRVVEEMPDVANAAMIGTITFDAAQARIVKTYAKGLDREAPRTYLTLDRPVA